MAKRTSFDQKAKGIHKSRQKIIDTVFGREDNTQRVFGYEKEADTKRKVGEIWTDSDGKTWQQRDGYKISVTKFDEIRDFLKKITNCIAKDCTTDKYDRTDKKLIAQTNMCFNCLQKFESKLKYDGVFNYYEDYKITKNKLSYARDLKEKLEQSLKDISTQLQMVNEDGTIQNWIWDVDIKKVKEDIQKDIDDVVNAIAELLQRQNDLENIFIELKRPDLIK